MRSLLNFILVPFLGFAFFSFGHVAQAQLANMQDPLQFIISPEVPGPNAIVRMEVQGVGPFLGNSVITWKQDGKKVSQGLGKTTFSFTTGGVGSATKIEVLVSAELGDYVRTYVFAPSVVEMLWEADTSTPLFYLGKSLFTAGSRLKVLAYPAIASGRSLVPSGKLSFNWSLNGQPATAQSGLGKDVFYIDGDMLHNSEEVKLDIFLSGVKVGRGEIAIPTVDPKILIYNKDPLRGEILDQALPGTFGLGSNEITLQAEPYYFANTSKRAGQLSYAWMLNSRETTGPDAARGILTLRQTGQGGGAANVSVTVQNNASNALVQSAQSALNIFFGIKNSNSSTPPFGL